MSIQAFFSKRVKAREQHVKKSVSDWMAAHRMNGQALQVEKGLTYLFTGIQTGSGKKIKKTVKALGEVKLSKEQTHISLLLAESLYLAGLYYPPKKKKHVEAEPKKGGAQKPGDKDYFERSASLCREVISLGADEASVKTAKTMLGRILLQKLGTIGEARKMLEEAGTPAALIFLAENAREYLKPGHENYLEAINFYKRVPVGSLPEKIRAIVKSNMAVSQFIYCFAKSKAGEPYWANHLIEAIGSMKEALEIIKTDHARTNLGALCNGIICMLGGKQYLSFDEKAALQAAQKELDAVEGHFQKIRNDNKPDYTTDERASWPAPIFMSVPESFAVDSIPAKAN